jgi:hypothetical protein
MSMIDERTGVGDLEITALTQTIAGAPDPQIMRIVALVDSMMLRGPADLLIEPLRRRLRTLRPPRPLRLARLIFYPLDPLIEPASRWRPGQYTIPRSALMPMTELVSLVKGPAVAAIEAEIDGFTTADIEVISRLGRSLWPEAAAILADAGIPRAWDATELGDESFRSLTNTVAALLAEAATLDIMRSEAATGLLPPPPELLKAMLSRVVGADEAALPMMIALLLDCLPETGELLPALHAGSDAEAIHAAMDQAAELLMRQHVQEDAIERRIAAGTLAEAGAAVGRIAALLKYLDTANGKPRRREWLRSVRQRLEVDCKARFASGLQDELLAPLLCLGVAPRQADIPALEAAARGLRVLETEGRVAGSGATYDLLLGRAAEVIKDNAMRDRLTHTDQMRLIEILTGPDAALAMLNQMP